MRFGLLVSFAWLAGVALAQRTDAMFDQNCASCHEVGSTANSAKAPDRKAISKLTTEAIYASLTTGSMKDRAQSLTDPQKLRLAEFLGGLRKLGAVEAGVETGSAARMPNRCPDNPPLGDISSSPSWNGWSTDGTNTRFQSSANAGIAAADVPRLKLKWAFGLPGATHVYGQRVRCECPDRRKVVDGPGGGSSTDPVDRGSESLREPVVRAGGLRRRGVSCPAVLPMLHVPRERGCTGCLDR